MTSEEIERAQSLVMSIASDEVRAILDEFSGVLGDIRNADAMISDMKFTERLTGQPSNPTGAAAVSSTDDGGFGRRVDPRVRARQRGGQRYR